MSLGLPFVALRVLHALNQIIVSLLSNPNHSNHIRMHRGLQSKKLAYLEQQLSSNLKATQNRIWTGVTKDVGYLRRMLNELYILKVKVNERREYSFFIIHGPALEYILYSLYFI